jgi:hypothetical protein
LLAVAAFDAAGEMQLEAAPPKGAKPQGLDHADRLDPASGHGLGRKRQQSRTYPEAVGSLGDGERPFRRDAPPRGRCHRGKQSEQAAATCDEHRPFRRAEHGQGDHCGQADRDRPCEAAGSDQPAVRDDRQALLRWRRHGLVQPVGNCEQRGSHTGRLVVAEIAKPCVATGGSPGTDAYLGQAQNPGQEWLNEVDRLGTRQRNL